MKNHLFPNDKVAVKAMHIFTKFRSEEKIKLLPNL